MAQAYQPLTDEGAIQYVRQLPGLFEQTAELVNREIGDGNLNLVFHIVDQQSDKSVIIKQALPYARVVGESWPLTLDRARIESETLKKEAERAPGLVPKVFHYDPVMALTVMEDLSDHIILRTGLIQRQRYPRLAEDIATFLAHTLFFTSDYYLDPASKKELVRQFINPELCNITEGLVFTDPYYDADTNSFNPHIRPQVEAIWSDAVLKREVATLKESFMTKAQALLHGDLHTGSIMVTDSSTKVIDPEFAFVGPIGFDIGAFLANLFLSFASHEGQPGSITERREYQVWLLETAQQTWHRFEQQFRTLWQEHVRDEMWKTPGYVDQVLQEILVDSIGFAGCKMMRRVIGLAPVADLETIEDERVRAEAERLALHIGRECVLQRRSITDGDALVHLVQSIAAQKEVQI
ncbi:S-methyl-5-thioribose kinase [Desmospora activa]|uniref:Methylthioribose kinase n=1 Tax=Desmospora activa DSM 45169 TaxID=1121389 RepID=A0A2T4Z1Q3_9BACL|nr:S-methyl-5-thioribose kinase [Desmospora activa]PTM54692.1 5'-methylthioribose kinase [Desmospora activa DSM 45169]